MKYFLSIAIWMTCAANISAQTKQRQAPAKKPDDKGTLFFDLTNHNFGKINESDGKVKHVFKYRNIGQFPVTILSVDPGCGCTAAEFKKTPIAQGEQGGITIEFDPQNRLGGMDRTIVVRTDGKPEFTYLSISGEVINPRSEYLALFPSVQGNVRFSDYNINFPSILDSRTDSTVVTILNNSSKNLHITSIKGPYHIRGVAKTPVLIPGQSADIMLYYYGEMVNDYGSRLDEVFIQTSDDTLPQKILNVRANIIQDFSGMTEKEKKNPPVAFTSTNEVDFGEVYLGEVVSRDFMITNKGKSDLRIRKAKASCGCTVGSYTKDVIKKGKTGIVTIKFNAKDLRGNISKDVLIFVNDPSRPVIQVKVKARVVIPGVDTR
ncbi:MAG: DUF1573 domain-containing protein [Bacteroidota bacterium]|jgi:hypothetical protein